ncbi:unnamed protein product [Pleuronectes platessa]|uniref:Uncharacterized protein n=1 Tax=Pleuronectes platessa TaxID=8262 RepID=A0A9N7UP22_PLEPL|nr:unnamed protein product [Pleuronectes platessa]
MHFSSGSSEQLNQTSSAALLARGPCGPPKRRGISTSIRVWTLQAKIRGNAGDDGAKETDQGPRGCMGTKEKGSKRVGRWWQREAGRQGRRGKRREKEGRGGERRKRGGAGKRQKWPGRNGRGKPKAEKSLPIGSPREGPDENHMRTGGSGGSEAAGVEGGLSQPRGQVGRNRGGTRCTGKRAKDEVGSNTEGYRGHAEMRGGKMPTKENGRR